MSICPVQTITFQNVEHKTFFGVLLGLHLQNRLCTSFQVMGQSHGRRILQKKIESRGQKNRVGRVSGNIRLFCFA